MNMVRHQAIGVEFELKMGESLGNKAQVCFTVAGREKYPLLIIAARHDVVIETRVG